MTKLEFHVGNYKFHDVPVINFQLNRFHAIGGDFKELKEIAAKVTDLPSFCELMGEAAKKAKAESRTKAAVAYLRAEEFFTTAKEGKVEVYEDYKKLFYQANAAMIEENNVQRAEVPYENGFLPVLYCVNPNPKGVVVVFGGFDSYVEEHLKFMVYMYQNGYSAYIFEGPGQGECINRYHIPFTPDWHKPVGAVLDYFHLDGVALMGISFGAILVKRAAAKEKRVKYVCSVGIGISMLKGMFARMPEEFADNLIKLIGQGKKDEVNEIMYGLMEKSPMYSWSTNHALHVFGVNTPYDYLCSLKEYDIEPIADQITQDYLIVAGQNDHFLQLSMSHDEIDVMQNVRSFTMRIITAKEQGDDHCNLSNRRLMIDTFANWLEETKKHIAELEEQCQDA